MTHKEIKSLLRYLNVLEVNRVDDFIDNCCERFHGWINKFLK